MAGLTIKIEGYDKLIRALHAKGEAIKKEVAWEFAEAAEDIRKMAIRKAPSDESGIRNSITHFKVGDNHEIAVGKNYAPFVEFGTKRNFKAPAELGNFPAQFRGFKGTGGNPIDALQGWVHRKGLAGRGKGDRTARERSIAFLIWRKIKREGIKAQPYLIPAFFEGRRKLIGHLRNILKQTR